MSNPIVPRAQNNLYEPNNSSLPYSPEVAKIKWPQVNIVPNNPQFGPKRFDPVDIFPNNNPQLFDLEAFNPDLVRAAEGDLDLSFATSDGEKPQSWINTALNGVSGAIEWMDNKLFPAPSHDEVQKFFDAITNNDTSTVRSYLTRRFRDLFEEALIAAVEARKIGFITNDPKHGPNNAIIAMLTKAVVRQNKDCATTALMNSIENSLANIVSTMLDSGVITNVDYLELAIKVDSTDIVKALIKNKRDLIDFLERNCLHDVVRDGKIGIASALIDGKIDVNLNLDTLIVAVKKHYVGLVEEMIKAGADLDNKYYIGRKDLISIAYEIKNLDLMEIFLRAKYGDFSSSADFRSSIYYDKYLELKKDPSNFIQD